MAAHVTRLRTLAIDGGGEPGGAHGDRVLGVRVDGDRYVEVGTDELADERNAARSSDEHDRLERAWVHAGGTQSPAQRSNRLAQRRPDHVLELSAGEADLGLQA